MIYNKTNKLLLIIILSSIICFGQNEVKFMEVTGSCSKVILSFDHDLNVEKAKSANNYKFTPNDVDNLIVTVTGKFIVLDGLKLKIGKTYKITMNTEVQGDEGEPLENQVVKFTPKYKKRKVRISTVQPLRIEEWSKCFSTAEGGKKGYLKYIEGLIDEAGAMNSDLIVLPEDIPNPWGDEEKIPGNFSKWFSKKAKQYNSYLMGVIIESKGEDTYTTAVLFDREGKIVGKYNKMYLIEPSTKIPGNSFPVFDTDFGKVGIQICFDIIASESFHQLALNGAEIILYPHANGSLYEMETMIRMKGLTVSNSIYLVASHFGRLLEGPADGYSNWFGRSCIINPSGYIVADAGIDPGVVSAMIDLNRKRLGVGFGDWGIGDIKYRINKHYRPELYKELSTPKNDK